MLTNTHIYVYIYIHTFQSLSAAELDDLDIDMILMSPPCQPFTRVGLKKGLEDARSSSFVSLLKALEK